MHKERCQQTNKAEEANKAEEVVVDDLVNMMRNWEILTMEKNRCKTFGKTFTTTRYLAR